MVRLDNFFSKKTASKSAPLQGAVPSNQPLAKEQAVDLKSQRLERRELLYAVVRESMARVGMLSSSYKYKVLSLDSLGNEYLIMMDLPREMAEHIGQLAEIEQVITQNASQRHHIDVTAVYWRVNELANVATTLLRKPRAFGEDEPQGPLDLGEHKRRFEPIRPDEVQAFKRAQAAAGARRAPAQHPSPAADFAPSEFPTTKFEETRLDEDRMPLSRTQYGDLI
ncbi:MAG: hypothetical protein ACK5RC_10180 [Curvibacter sp.]|jgi:hypothetical protein|nr:hypothetical protein [Curvibacter sp.]